MARPTRSIALSLSRPVGSPRPSRTISPPGDVLRLSRDPGELQGQRVGKGHVSVQSVHEDRVIGGDRVQKRPRGLAFRRPALVVPVAVQDPGSLRELLRVCSDAPRQLGLVRGVAQVHREQAEAAGHEVHVSVVEARDDEPAPQLHHPGLRPGELGYVGVAPEREHPLPLKGDGGGGREALPRPDLASVEHEVCGLAHERHSQHHKDRGRQSFPPSSRSTPAPRWCWACSAAAARQPPRAPGAGRRPAELAASGGPGATARGPG